MNLTVNIKTEIKATNDKNKGEKSKKDTKK